MDKYLAILLMVSFNYVSTQDGAEGSECICVPYYLCKNGSIITDGMGLVNERIGLECKGDFEMCCKLETLSPTVRKPEPSKGCGYRNPDGVGFRKAADSSYSQTEMGEFPWMVGIIQQDGDYRCGGSIIHPSVVLTAAHCVVGHKDLTVRAGEWDSTNVNEVLPHQDRKISSMKIHENYTPGNYFNDIALLFLTTPFEYKAHIKAACLAPKDAVIDSGRCFVTGWGKTSFGKGVEFPAILKEVELPMISRDTCQQQFRKTRLGQFFQLHKSFVCAGGEEGKDACTGDGGGPLVCPIEGQEERYQQIGIVSWGLECNEKDTPGAYANVAYLRDWIDGEVKKKNFVTDDYRY